MLRHFTKRRWLVVLLGVAAVLAVIFVVKWKSVSDHGGQKPAEPFRIAGNLYYVGANDVTSFLRTGPEGHVLLDGGLSRHRPDDHGEYREARLQHPRRQSAAQLAHALRPRGRSGGAPEGTGY